MSIHFVHSRSADFITLPCNSVLFRCRCQLSKYESLRGNNTINCVILYIYMARKKLEERHVRKLLKNTGGTMLVSLPIEVVRELKWRDGQKVVVKKRGEGILIADWNA